MIVLYSNMLSYPNIFRLAKRCYYLKTILVLNNQCQVILFSFLTHNTVIAK